MAAISFASLIAAVATESHPLSSLPPWLRLVVRPPTEGHVNLKAGSFPGHWINVVGNSIGLTGQTAVEIYERAGKKALADYVTDIEDTVRIHFFLFDEQMDRLTKSPLPAEANDLTARLPSNGLDYKRSGEYIFTAQQLTGPSGKKYTLITSFSARHFLTRDYSNLAVRLFFIFITAGGVCYWLAKYIATPISKLGAAARRLADGDLKVRVGAGFSRRHDEIAELGMDFDLMAERIESLINSQKRLLRDISHEFRSPLTRLTLALEIARRSENEEAFKALDRIELEAGRLNALIGKLLVLSRLESGAEELEKAPVNMAELVEELAADADFEARGRNCRVRVVSADNCSVLGNSELLRSAVENVLRNAVRHTAENTEISVFLRCKKNGGSNRAVIEICDKGPGVPAEALSDIFDPFYRVGDARDRKRGGTGLGLAITQRAVELHNGRVWAANILGGGLNITIELPAAKT